MNAQPASTTAPNTAETEIRAVLDRWLEAVRAQDLDRIMACYAPDVLAFDAVLALQFKGRESYGKHWKACLEMCPGPLVFEMADVAAEASGDLAFAHYLTRCGYVDKDGQEKASWMRATMGFRREGGRWLVAHDHFSVPFDPESGKAIFDATP